MKKYFLMQIKRTNGTIEKGVVVKDTLEGALQGYHAYLGAYGFGNNANTDYVFAAVFDVTGLMVEWYVYDNTNVPESEPGPEEA